MAAQSVLDPKAAFVGVHTSLTSQQTFIHSVAQQQGQLAASAASLAWQPEPFAVSMR